MQKLSWNVVFNWIHLWNALTAISSESADLQLLPCHVVPWRKKLIIWQHNFSGRSFTRLSSLQVSSALLKKKKKARLENPVWVWQMFKKYTLCKNALFFPNWIISFSHSGEECPGLSNCPHRGDESKLKSTIQTFSLSRESSPRLNLLTLSLFSLKHRRPSPVGKHELYCVHYTDAALQDSCILKFRFSRWLPLTTIRSCLSVK